MGPYLPYKPAPPSRKTNLLRTSQSGKTNSHKAVKRTFRVHHRAVKRTRAKSQNEPSAYISEQENEPSAYNALVSISPYNNSRSAIWRVLTGTLPPLRSRLPASACVCVSACAPA